MRFVIVVSNWEDEFTIPDPPCEADVDDGALLAALELDSVFVVVVVVRVRAFLCVWQWWLWLW